LGRVLFDQKTGSQFQLKVFNIHHSQADILGRYYKPLKRTFPP
jgi:hypothetical protein